MKNLILESARGLGKTSIAKYIRENTTNSTLINFTGFNEDGKGGLDKVLAYYVSWGAFFRSMKQVNHEYLFIHDRYFFSEQVYHKLYKSYDFATYYYGLLNNFEYSFDDVVLVFLVNNSKEELKRNLSRDKALLFDNVAENVEATLLQQERYLEVAKELEAMEIPNLTIKYVETTGKTIEQLGDEILTFIK